MPKKYQRWEDSRTEAEKDAARAERDAKIARWRKGKEFLEANQERLQESMAALVAQATFGRQISLRSYAFVLEQLEEQGLAGTPYIDTKTFKEWRAVGRCVNKGEKAKLFSITWIDKREGRGEDGGAGDPGEGGEDGSGGGRLWPKITFLFHVDQTRELAEGERGDGRASASGGGGGSRRGSAAFDVAEEAEEEGVFV